MNRISVCVILNKWHPKLPHVLDAAANVASEILLGVNGECAPADIELANLPKVVVVHLPWQGYGATKNELARKATNDWILSLDSDEVLDEELQASLAALELEDERAVYSFAMRHFLGDKALHFGAWGRSRKRFFRLYHRKFASWDGQEVHESIRRPASARLFHLPGKVLHYTSRDERELLQKSRHYADLAASKRKRAGKRASTFRGFLSAFFFFVKSYFFQLGFLDGRAGWQVTRAHTLYTFWKYQ